MVEDNVRMAIPRKSTPTTAANPESNTATVTPVTTATAAVPAEPKSSPASDVAGTVNRISPDAVPATPATVSQSQPPSQPHPAVTLPTAATVPVPDDDLPGILKRLTPIQRAKLRSAAISEGIIQQSTGARENADGSISVMIRVDGDLVPQLKTWAEEANKSVHEQIQEIVGMLLSSYLIGPWQAPEPVAAPVAAATVGEPAAK